MVSIYNVLSFLEKKGLDSNEKMVCKQSANYLMRVKAIFFYRKMFTTNKYRLCKACLFFLFLTVLNLE